MNKQIRIGVAGILIRNKKILLNLRKKKPGQNIWGLPAGHLEFGEGLEQALKREFVEETGLKVEINKLVSVATNQKYGNHYIMFTYLVDLLDKKQKVKLKEPENHKKWEWFAIPSLPEKLFIATQNALRDYKANKIYKLGS